MEEGEEGRQADSGGGGAGAGNVAQGETLCMYSIYLYTLNYYERFLELSLPFFSVELQSNLEKDAVAHFSNSLTRGAPYDGDSQS